MGFVRHFTVISTGKTSTWSWYYWWCFSLSASGPPGWSQGSCIWCRSGRNFSVQLSASVFRSLWQISCTHRLCLLRVCPEHWMYFSMTDWSGDRPCIPALLLPSSPSACQTWTSRSGSCVWSPWGPPCGAPAQGSSGPGSRSDPRKEELVGPFCDIINW